MLLRSALLNTSCETEPRSLLALSAQAGNSVIIPALLTDRTVRDQIMNLKNLHHVYTTSPESITELAERNGLDPVVSIGVVKLLIANDGNLASLSSKQQEHFALSVKPLIEE